MKITIAIVDDNLNDGKRLRRLIEEWADSANVITQVFLFEKGDVFLEAINSTVNPYDVVFLDIMMPDKNGYDLAKELCIAHEKLPKVFCSSAIEYTFAGYIVKAVRYLLKFASDFEEQVFECMNYLVELFRQEGDVLYLTDKIKGRHAPIPFSNILMITSEGNYITIHTVDGVIRQRSTLKSLTERLPEYFVKCNRSTLVNVHYIKKITSRIILVFDNRRIAISDVALNDVLSTYDRFM